MSEATYWIFAGSEPVTNATNSIITDLDQAKGLAAAVSRDQPDVVVSVVSRKPEGAGEWGGTPARYKKGQEIPWRWRVDFFGHLLDLDHLHLSQASIFYERGHSEIGPGGEVRPGYARNIVTLDAWDEDAAIEKVKEALGPTADACAEWHVNPA
jgi:hypothetical protein